MSSTEENNKKRLIVICQSGGKFSKKKDGTMSYEGGGDAHALSVTRDSKFDEFKAEVSEMWGYDPNAVTVKYFLPNNRKTLITVSSDKDIQRMVDFHGSSSTVDVYAVVNDPLVEEIVTRSPPVSRSNRKKMATEIIPVPVEVTPINAVHEGDTPIASVHGDVTPVAAVHEDAELNNSAIVHYGQHELFKSWENCITGLNQQFNSVKEVREALRKYSIAHGFVLAFKHNDNDRVSAKCKAEGCPWRIHVSRLVSTKYFRVKTFHAEHTCGNGADKPTPRTSSKVVAYIMKEKLRDSPNSKPKEIADQIREEFGLDLGYTQAWRGLEAAKEELLGPLRESYNQLPSLCKKMMEKNPGSVVNLVTREDLTFHRLFVAFHSSLFGFLNGCRPLIFLDTLELQADYRSDMLVAMALDGNDDIFPLAFALVDIANDDNWCWFLLEMKSAVSTFEQITFVADRRLRNSISMVFENSFHGYCLQHLSEELKEYLKISSTEEVFDVIVPHIYDAALAVTLDGFRKCMDTIRSISPEACEWILKSEPKQWANSLFQGSRYNHFEAGIGDSFYSWVNEVPVLPVTEVIDNIRRKMMELIYTRKVESDQWMTKLTPSIEEKLQKEALKAQSLHVLSSPTNMFEVRDFLGATNFVNIDTWECTCKGWQLDGFPCSHAMSVLKCTGRDIFDYCSKYFKTEAYRFAYLEPINPVPTADKPGPGEVLVNPPPPRLLSGPPKKRRIRGKDKVKRPLHCGKCKGMGHNRATCHIYS